MKKFITLILVILISILIFSREFVFLTEIEHGTVKNRRDFGPQMHDFNRNGKDELIMWSFMGGSFVGESFLYFYEYQDDYSFELIQTNYYASHIWMAGIGDFDNDGLYEILGGIADSSYIYLMEQSDSFDLPDSISWHSDTIYNTNKFLISTNKLKPDSLNRIAGLGIPGISTTVYGMGFYYYECSGDDSYYMKTFEESLWTGGALDVGDIDDNGKAEMIFRLIDGGSIVRYEVNDSTADSFTLIDTTYEKNISNLLILEDTDGDGRKELLTQKLIGLVGNPSDPSHKYGYNLYEDDNGDGSLDSIWATDFEVKNNNDVIAGGDIDYGDIDGDGNNEIVICGGRHFEVWKASGNNSYYKMFEWTNPDFTTTESHIRCFDFNKNGIDEVIYSGSGTYVGDEATFIFECRPLPKLDYDNPYDLGDKPLSTTVTDSLYLRDIDELPVVIDSLKLLNSNEITLNNPSYPCSVPSYDSLPITFDIYSDTSTFITDTLIVYSNDWYGEVDTIEVNAGVGAQIVLDSAVAYDNRNEEEGIDYDDCVKLYFNYPIDPPDTSTLNLDSILSLSDNHTWYDGTGNIKQINYTRNNTVMTIWLSTDTNIPTVLVGDSIYPDTASITDKHYYSYLKDPVMITGSFGPTGIGDNNNEQEDIIITITFNVIQIQNNTNSARTYQITDITGRIIDNITVKKGLNTYSPHQSGIYFIINKNKDIIKKAIIVK